MPVLRKRESVQVQQGPTGVIKSRQNVALNNVWAMSDLMAEEAAKYGRLMGQEAEDKAIGLARSAVFSQDQNGTPQMPDDPTKTWGRIAQRVYTDNVEARYADRLAVSVKAHVEAAKNEFPYDLEQFQAAVNGRLDGMQGSVPDQYSGLFQDIVADMKTTAGAQIGRSQGAMMDQQQSETALGQNDNVSQQLIQLIQSGEMEAASAVLGDQVAHINAYPRHILSDGQKNAMISDLVVSTGTQRLIMDQNVAAMNQGQLAVLIADLNTNNPDVMEYFTMPNDQVPTEQMLRQAASKLNAFYATANGRTSAESTFNHMKKYATGRADDNQTSRNIGDMVVADQIGLVDPETGMRRAMNYTDWTTMSPEDLAHSIQTVKSAGIFPTSLHELFKQIEHGAISDETSLNGAYDTWMALRLAPNRAGDVRDMTVNLGENTKRLFTLASALVDNGSAGDTPLEEAATLISSLAGQEWTDLALAQALTRADTADNWLFNGERVQPENARKAMEARVMEVLSQGGNAFDGVDPAPQEIKEAQMLYETFLRLGESEEDVISMINQSLEGRWAETDVMLGVARSAFDPDTRYGAPQSKSAMESLEWFGRQIGGEVVGAAEGFRTLYSEVLSLGFEDRETDWGADLLQAEPWEFAADKLIRDELLANVDAETYEEMWEAMGYREGEGSRSSPLRAGEHYKLVPDSSGTRDNPVYRVFMLDGTTNRMTEVTGGWRLDLRPAMDEMEANFASYHENMARLRESVSANPPASIEDFHELIKQFGLDPNGSLSAYDYQRERAGY